MFVTGNVRMTRGGARAALRTDASILEALEEGEADQTEEDDLLSTAGSLHDLTQWLGQELESGKELRIK